jgi:SecD/SecF fusion protein
LITLCSGIFLKTGDKTLILQAGRDASQVELKQSADIISSRLDLYGTKSFDVSVLPEKGQLLIRLPESAGAGEIESLVTSRGELAFFETYTQEELKVKLNNDNQLFKLLNPLKDNKSSDPRVGCADNVSRRMVQEHLESAPELTDCKLLWQAGNDKSETCLFALKTENGKPLINRSDIESVKISDSNEGTKIMIKLKPSSVGVFADATKANLNKSIAIVIDNKVYSWPVVRSVIEKGEIEVTGSFTKNEAKYFPVIFNTGQLPLSFKVVK